MMDLDVEQPPNNPNADTENDNELSQQSARSKTITKLNEMSPFDQLSDEPEKAVDTTVTNENTDDQSDMPKPNPSGQKGDNSKNEGCCPQIVTNWLNVFAGVLDKFIYWYVAITIEYNYRTCKMMSSRLLTLLLLLDDLTTFS